MIRLLLSSTFFCGVTSYAMATTTLETHISAYQTSASELKLDEHKTWHRLLYLDSKNNTSKVNLNSFFLSVAEKEQDTKINAKAELDTNIQALFNPLNSDQAFRCKFPARSQWLIEQLKIPSSILPDIKCAEFDTWVNTIKPHKITMIFATDFMGNPSSMFGHTLLRLDPKDQAELNLVSYALNYAATPETKDGDFAYAWKGLTGKYPSQYSLMSYYHKVKEYGDLESRDLWEYELNISPEDTLFITKHIWELQDVRFPYYFINDNCSYALLGLFDLLDPNSNLQEQFDLVAVPVETIKSLEKADLIKAVVYRPALETQLLSQAKQHGKNLAEHAHQVAYLEPNQHQDYLEKFSALDRAKILEMAYDDLYLALISRRTTKEFAQPRLRALLGQRSQIEAAKQRKEPEIPVYNPVEGHHSRSLIGSVGRVQNQEMLEIEHRQAYHDLTDPQAGHRFGTQLIFFQGKLQLTEDQLKLDHFKLMSVSSLNPINPFKTPLSWGMHFGWQQESVHQGKFSPDEQHGVLNFNAQAGYSLTNQENTALCYGQMQGIVQAGQSLEKGWRVAPAPTFGCLNQWTEKTNTIVQLEVPFWLEQEKWNLRVNSQWQYAFNQNNAVRLNWQYQLQENLDWHKFSLGYAHYF